MKIAITPTRSLLLIVATFTISCSQKKQQGCLLPKEIMQKIVLYTPTTTKERLILVSKDMFQQAYPQLEDRRINSFRNYLSFSHFCFPSQNATLSFKKKFQHYSYEVQQKDLSTLKSILKKDENYTVFYTMLMNYAVSSYFTSDAWMDEFNLKRRSASVTINVSNAGAVACTIKTVALSDDVLKKIRGFNKKATLELINKTLVIKINTDTGIDSFSSPVYNRIVSIINELIQKNDFVNDTDNVRMIFEITINKNNEHEHFNQIGGLIRWLFQAYSNNVKIIDISNQGIAECGKDVTLFATLFPQDVKIFMSGDHFYCARKEIRKNYCNVFFRPVYIDEIHESADDAEDFRALDVDDIKYLCENGFSIPLVYLIKNNHRLLCGKDDFPRFCAVFNIITKYISPLSAYKASLCDSEQEFTVLDALIQQFLRIPYEGVVERIAQGNTTCIHQSQQIYRPYVIQFANYIASTIQNLGIDIKSYTLAESQETILNTLFLQYEKTKLEDKKSLNMCERMKVQNQQFKQQALVVTLLDLHNRKEIRFIQRKMFQSLFYTLLNLNVFEEKVGRGVELKYNLPYNSPEADCEYIIALMKELDLDINCMFGNNATLLQNCFFYGNKLDRLKTQYQTMLLYKLLNSGVDCIATERERTLAGFFKNLSQFHPCDQTNIFNEFVKNIIKYDGYKTILHTYFKHASTLNLNIIHYIINRDNFDINAFEFVLFLIENFFFIDDFEQEPIFKYSVEHRTIFEYFLYFCFRLGNELTWNDSMKIFTTFIERGFDFYQKTGTGQSFTSLIDAYLAQGPNPLLAHLGRVLKLNYGK